MLRIAKLQSAAHSYYLEVASSQRSTGIEPAGLWIGRGSSDLGLQGEVSEEALAAVLDGFDPIDGNPLRPSAGRSKVGGYDLTFGAPKSVSILYALGDDEVSEEVRKSHERAVASACGYVENRAFAVGRKAGDGKRYPTEASAVAQAAFLHRVSRALDPHLHTHVVVANLARDCDGRFLALDARGIYAHGAATSALYHSQLRAELACSLGIEWETPRRGLADIVDIGPDIRREFSTRARQIEAHLAELGLSQAPSNRAREVAGHATRANRDPNMGFDLLRDQWLERASTIGLDREALCKVTERRGWETDRPAVVPDTSTLGSEFPASSSRWMTRRQVVRELASSCRSGARVEEIEQEADRVLGELTPADGWRGKCDGPGVAERRYLTVSLDLAKERWVEQASLDRLLQERGMGIDRSPDRGLSIGL